MVSVEQIISVILHEDVPRRDCMLFLFDCAYITHPPPGIEPSGRMRCAISSMSFMSAFLDTL